jgi:hypothetical protein
MSVCKNRQKKTENLSIKGNVTDPSAFFWTFLTTGIDDMNKFFFAAVATTGLLFGGAAIAANLTNYDEAEQTVVIVENGTETSVSVGPEKTVEDICNSGCTIRLSNGAEYELNGNEIASIEQEQLYIDGELNEQGGDAGTVDPNSAQ